jgi:hypothetical protein
MTVAPEAAARIALTRQGLVGAAPFGRGLAGAARALEALGYVQIDTISVVARAHHHTLWSRVPGFREAHLDTLVAERKAFEYWAHAAAYLPMRHYRFALPRMHAYRGSERHWIRNPDYALMRAVVDRIRAEGPLRSRDFEDAQGGAQGWWQWKPAKRALEQLYIQGEIMVSRRDGMEKVFDLPERVLPADVDTRPPSTREWAEHLVDTTLDAHGFAPATTITYQRRSEALRRAVKALLAERVADGSLEVAKLPDGLRVYAARGLFDAPPRRPPPRVRLLSPFDNAIIDRARTLAVHGFDYVLECYVPAPKRRWGYYCLPIVYRDALVGRLDAKADRNRGSLVLRRVWIERDVGDPDAFLQAFAACLLDYAAFNGCADVEVGAVTPARWKRPLARCF